MKNILVTGGAGFIGTNLIKLLLQQGFEVISVDNYSTGFVKNHQIGADYVRGDIETLLDFSFQPSGQKIDAVFHLAAIARIQPSFDRPVDYFKTNALGTFNVCQFCVKNDIPLIFAGSSSHHSGKFKNPYTFSKDVSEEIVAMHQKLYGLKASVARFYNVYGPHQLLTGAYCTLIGKWISAINSYEPITIYGDGTKRRDFTHVDDIVSALHEIYVKQAYGYEFELGRGKNYSVKEVAEMFEYDKIVYEADRPGEAQNTLCTDTLAKDLLGWQPRIELSDYIKSHQWKK